MTAATAPTPAFRPTWTDWLPPSVWTCPRCSAEQLTRELAPRCAICGFREAED